MTAKKIKRWKPVVGAALGGQEQKLVDALKGRASCGIRLLYQRVTGAEPRHMRSVEPRAMQQKVGAIAARFNKKRSGQRIQPGDLPNTYRLARVRR